MDEHYIKKTPPMSDELQALSKDFPTKLGVTNVMAMDREQLLGWQSMLGTFSACYTHGIT